MTDVDRGTARYTAFLSYSHKDAAAARWLHRKLETYRIPRRLAGVEGERGPVPARLTPIFRDREELPAAGDLSEKVRAALAASENLIVICSPNSAASPWVAREIAVFRELHPGRPVFAAIVDGEPDQCFPSELDAGGVEPLAADLRPGRDGRRLGFLKLVAGLTGVGLDALVQRDTQRRLRRVTAITAAALAGMLMMAVLTAFALSARSEAQRQRAEAEGLVEFMLTDLRDGLKGVGRLKLMTAVNARALLYYGEREDLDRLPDESLARRARILHAIGEDDLDLDDLSGTLDAYREARAITSELVARAPGDARRLFEHTKSLYGIGRVHELRHEWKAAQLHYSEFAAAADRLLQISPSNPDYLMKAASGAINLGNLKLDRAADYPKARRAEHYASAEQDYRKAVRLLERAVEVRPRDPHILMAHANALAWLADTFFMRGMWGESLGVRMRQYAIVEPLHRASPDNADFTFHLAVAERGASLSLHELGKFAAARTHLLNAERLTLGLVERDKENAGWQDFSCKLSEDFLELGLGFPPGTTKAQLVERCKVAKQHHPPHSTGSHTKSASKDQRRH